MEPNPLKIGIDADGVLAAFVKFFIPYTAKNLNVPTIEPEQIRDHYGMWQALGVEKQAVKDMIAQMGDDGSYALLEPMTGAPEAVEHLRKSYELHVITARPASVADVTEQWVHAHYPESFTGVHLSSSDIPHSEKVEICRREGISLVIEDNPYNARELAANGITCLLLKSPWNENEPQTDKILIMRDWRQIVETVDAIADAKEKTVSLPIPTEIPHDSPADRICLRSS